MLDLDPFKRPSLPSIRFRVISLGAGVQSTAMALMAAHGEIEPMPDCAIFADTQWEPSPVYRHLEWLSGEGVLPFPIHRVSIGSMRDELVKFGGLKGSGIMAPLYTKSRKDGSLGILRRSCTDRLKIVPILRHIRELAGIKAGTKAPAVEQWMGISLDEKSRTKRSLEHWKVNRYPLLEMRMRRSDCLEWMKRNGYPEPPKSACVGCPFRSNARWLELKETDPEGFADAIRIDEAIRDGNNVKQTLDSELFLHRSCRPLKEVPLSSEETGQDDLFDDECAGVCGV